MGLFKQAIFGIFAVLTYTYIKKWSASDLPVNFGGSWEPEFQDVADVFRKNVESGKEKGGAFAVYYKGRPVIDVWGGYADAESYRPWTENTTTVAFSCIKGVAAILLVKMMELGIINPKALVKAYWPEFAVNGKDNITVEMLMSHQAGLVYLDTPLSLREYIDDREKWLKTLADQSPAWPPGSQFGYHSLTFGMYVDELIQRADPQHRDTATIFKDLIGRPFGIDFGMNTPQCEFGRSARLVTKSKLQLLIDSLSFPRYLVPMFQIITQPNSPMAKSIVPIIEYAQVTCSEYLLVNKKFNYSTKQNLKGIVHMNWCRPTKCKICDKTNTRLYLLISSVL
ncbi:beta-lactamase domain-containing protein 2-like [Dreissena polymorpha]|uniref:beta-lactamase domain-containing protein 2-like n=1 Tax=Dreissena polymorpha TaxID=45954 RepID=UPI0022649060|nr:beta-lactamase domain-containing protein 2-like [Dreissena polymorpha]